jgi:hypothetical protein
MLTKHIYITVLSRKYMFFLKKKQYIIVKKKRQSSIKNACFKDTCESTELKEFPTTQFGGYQKENLGWKKSCLLFTKTQHKLKQGLKFLLHAVNTEFSL